jgi:hypothetical protein
MRDIRDVLMEKELQLEAVRREVDALRIVAPLLAEKSDDLKALVESADQVVWKDATTGEPVKAWL